MTVLYMITRYITFPGAFIRAYWEQVVCKNHKCPVEDNRYLRPDEQCSHIEHELMDKAGSSFAVGFVPMILQFITGLLTALSGILDILYLGSFSTEKIVLFGLNTSIPYGVLDIISLWLGASFLINCFPSVEDALNMKEKLYSKETNIIVKILLSPGAAILFIGAYLEKYCITFLTSLALIVVGMYVV